MCNEADIHYTMLVSAMILVQDIIHDTIQLMQGYSASERIDCTACAVGAVYKQQVDRLIPMIEASRSRPHHEQERLQQELQSLVIKASRDRCPLPQAEALLHDLKSAQVGTVVRLCMHQHLSGQLVQHADCFINVESRIRW